MFAMISDDVLMHTDSSQRSMIKVHYMYVENTALVNISKEVNVVRK